MGASVARRIGLVDHYAAQVLLVRSQRGGCAMGVFDWLKKSGTRPAPETIDPDPYSKYCDPDYYPELDPELGSVPGSPVLPSCNDVFMRFFDRWYSDEERERHGRHGTVRPDIARFAAPGTPVSEVSPLTPESGRTVIEFLRGLASAVSGAPGKIDLAWIQGFHAFYDRKELAKMLEAADPRDRRNPYAMTCQGFAAALGEVLIASMPGCAWLPDAPVWESAVYDPRGGCRINVFDWAVKKLSEYGVDDGYAMKVKVCVGMYEDEWRSLEKR
jgi:hypothetical protein